MLYELVHRVKLSLADPKPTVWKELYVKVLGTIGGLH